MNKIKGIKMIVLTIVLALSFASCDNQEVIAADKLPPKIKSYIAKHFPDDSIVQVFKSRDGLTKTFDIYLSGNNNLEFNRKNQIIGIDGGMSIPTSVISPQIRQYVKKKYVNQQITAWELDGKNQHIVLSNGIDLEFNKKGEFLRIDN